MNLDITPTRSVVLDLKDERRAMHEGYVFLDEKCLLLAGEMLRELERYAELQRDFVVAGASPSAALQAAVARHGLDGLEVHPPPDLRPGRCPSRAALADGGAAAGGRRSPRWRPPAPRARRPVAGGRGLPARVRRAGRRRRRRWPRWPAISSGCRASTGARCAAPARCPTCCCPSSTAPSTTSRPGSRSSSRKTRSADAPRTCLPRGAATTGAMEVRKEMLVGYSAERCST